MDKGQGHQYKGKALNEIDIDPEVDVADLEDSGDDELFEKNVKSSTLPDSQKAISSGCSMPESSEPFFASDYQPQSPELSTTGTLSEFSSKPSTSGLPSTSGQSTNSAKLSTRGKL